MGQKRRSQWRRDSSQFKTGIVGDDHFGPVHHMKDDAITRSDAARCHSPQGVRPPSQAVRKSTLLRERRAPRFLAAFVSGASKRLLESYSLDLPLLICRIQIRRAALPGDFSLGKTVAIVSERPHTWRKRGEARLRFRSAKSVYSRRTRAVAAILRQIPGWRPTKGFDEKVNHHAHLGAEVSTARVEGEDVDVGHVVSLQ